MSLKVVTVHIPRGESLSDGADCTEGTIIRVAAPRDGWDGANISFEVSTDDSPNYHALIDVNGEDVQVPVKIGCSTVVREADGLAPGWYKIRSGTLDNPVEQSGDRDFSFVLLTSEVSAPARSAVPGKGPGQHERSR
jgi:hypothetical protein